ncbi:Uroporphyrinogen-III synthase [Tepidimonas sediminis]|uniref:Uroporphyrinogen-III synthase n=1 Tax=Tepidimonas sediminis TaxID=2588941 RepID=A0A554WK55_9BURK|nr:uroporphyrinogen-III synthase [Tepidimonas sediminis]TSE23964.1 Uroporphyrinogen-III synthase [Tepidimonas sediminis]
MERPTVVVTRPPSQAAAWVRALRAAGWPAQALPLLAIESLLPPNQPAPWAAQARCDAVMVVSPAAVEVMRAAGWPPPPAPLRCWAPGQGTAGALRTWGVPPERLDAVPADAPRVEAEALWPQVAAQVRPGWRLLVVRGLSSDGGQGRDGLLRHVQAAGGRVETLLAYRRAVPAWDAAQQAAARQAAAGGVWLFSSGEAVANLAALASGADWAQAVALATHPRIAAAARAAGFGRVLTTRPTITDVLQALESVA